MIKKALDLTPGDEVLLELPAGWVTGLVTEVVPTNSVKFGQTGPDAVPMVEVHLSNLPKPFKGTVECAGDREFEVED